MVHHVTAIEEMYLSDKILSDTNNSASCWRKARSVHIVMLLLAKPLAMFVSAVRGKEKNTKYLKKDLPSAKIELFPVSTQNVY